MNQKLLDELSTAAAERYLDLINRFRGVLAAYIVENPRLGNKSRQLEKDLRGLGEKFLGEELEHTQRAIDLVKDQTLLAHQSDTGFEPSLTEYEEAFAEEVSRHIFAEVSAQIRRDIEEAKKHYLSFMLRVFVNSNLSTIERLESAHTEALHDFKGRIRFFFMDRSGRRIKSQAFVRLVNRAALVGYAIDLYVSQSSQRNIRQYRLIHADGNSAHHNEIVDYEGIEAMRDNIFHPNSKLFLRAINVRA